MAARAIWKGKLKIGSAHVPVKLYSAVQDRSVRFHVLDARSKTRVKQHMINPETGKEVPNDRVQKAFEAEPGVFVILNDKELDSLKPKPSREIELREFVPQDAINHQWY